MLEAYQSVDQSKNGVVLILESRLNPELAPTCDWLNITTEYMSL